MKAIVKATGDIVDVHRLCMSSQGDIWQEKSGKEYFAHELDFDVKEPPKPRYNPDYWTRLEHQYAGMAMQSYVSNNVYLREIREMCKEPQEMRDLIADLSILLAATLVQKLKEKEE